MTEAAASDDAAARAGASVHFDAAVADDAAVKDGDAAAADAPSASFRKRTESSGGFTSFRRRVSSGGAQLSTVAHSVVERLYVKPQDKNSQTRVAPEPASEPPAISGGTFSSQQRQKELQQAKEMQQKGATGKKKKKRNAKGSKYSVVGDLDLPTDEPYDRSLDLPSTKMVKRISADLDSRLESSSSKPGGGMLGDLLSGARRRASTMMGRLSLRSASSAGLEKAAAARRDRRKSMTDRRPAIMGGHAALELEKLRGAEQGPSDDATRDAIAAALLRSPLFESIKRELLHEIIGVMQKRTVAAGETVIEQGDTGFNFYVVQTGQYDCHVAELEKAITTFKGGDTFGELALMYNAPRTATIRCKAPGVVWALGGAVFRTLVCDHNNLQKHGLEELLKTMELFRDLDQQQLSNVANAMDTFEYDANEYIVEKGEHADALFLILAGEVVCHIEGGNEKELARLTRGQCFGESAVKKAAVEKAVEKADGEGGGEGGAASNGRQQQQRVPERLANVVAVTNVRLARLHAKDFFRILGSFEEIVAANFRKKILASVPLLDALAYEEIKKLSEVMTEVTVPRGEAIIKQRELGDSSFYIIKSGSVAIQSNDKQVAELGQGQFFGERALLRSEPASASVVANDDNVCLLTLKKEQFEEMLGPLQRRLDAVARERDATFHPKIVHTELRPVAIIGQGSFAEVKLVKHVNDNRVFALKAMYKGQLICHEQVDHVISERRIVAKCNHPFILRLETAYMDETQVFMVHEVALGGELFCHLQRDWPTHRLPERNAAIYAAIVTLIWGYLHDRSIVHRDLKPENLLFDERGYLKLCDFGFAKELLGGRTFTLCGTPDYLAPEVITNNGHGVECDWWELGILLYEMLAGSTPFGAESPVQTYRNIVRGKYKPLDHDDLACSPEATILVSRLLNSNPSGRYGGGLEGTAEVMGHPIFAKHAIDFSALEMRRMPMPWIPTIRGKRDTSNFDVSPTGNGDQSEQWASYLRNDIEEKFVAAFGTTDVETERVSSEADMAYFGSALTVGASKNDSPAMDRQS